MTIAAKYEDGVFKPLEDVKVKEGTVEPVKRRRSIKDGIGYVNNLRDNPRPYRYPDIGLMAYLIDADVMVDVSRQMPTVPDACLRN